PGHPVRRQWAPSGRGGRSQEIAAKANVSARRAARRWREGVAMNRISAWAVVETEAIGADVAIAEFAVVRPNVTIGNRVVIHPHVVIESGARIGDNVEIFPGAYIGKAPKGPLTRAPRFEAWVDIGAGCSIGAHP